MHAKAKTKVGIYVGKKNNKKESSAMVAGIRPVLFENRCRRAGFGLGGWVDRWIGGLVVGCSGRLVSAVGDW